MARTPDDDDAALRWDDVEDASYVDPGAATDEPAARDADVTTRGTASDAAGVSTASAADARAARRRSVTTAVTGIFAGVYLMYTVGWIIGVAQLPLTGPDLLTEVLYQFAEFLAIIAPAAWLTATLVISRGRSAWHRFGWLALGTLVLVPWPFLLGVIR